VEISEAAAPVTRAAEKARLFIIMISLPSRMDGNVWLHGVGGAERRRTPGIFDVVSPFTAFLLP
jgi:hypothetical protein